MGQRTSEKLKEGLGCLFSHTFLQIPPCVRREVFRYGQDCSCHRCTHACILEAGLRKTEGAVGCLYPKLQFRWFREQGQEGRAPPQSGHWLVVSNLRRRGGLWMVNSRGACDPLQHHEPWLKLSIVHTEVPVIAQEVGGREKHRCAEFSERQLGAVLARPMMVRKTEII